MNIHKVLEYLFIARKQQNKEIAAKFMNEDQFWGAVTQLYQKDFYKKIREEGTLYGI